MKKIKLFFMLIFAHIRASFSVLTILNIADKLDFAGCDGNSCVVPDSVYNSHPKVEYALYDVAVRYELDNGTLINVDISDLYPENPDSKYGIKIISNLAYWFCLNFKEMGIFVHKEGDRVYLVAKFTETLKTNAALKYIKAVSDIVYYLMLKYHV